MKNLKLSLVGFFDILGFKEKVRGLHSIRDLKKLDGQLKKVQEFFTDSLEERRLFDKDVLILSDSIITSLPIESQGTKYSGTFDSFLYDIAGYAYAQWDCVANHVFIRGGLDLNVWYKAKNRIISAGLVEAVELEKAVCVPMIGITSEAYKLLAELPGRKAYSAGLDPMKWSFVKYEPEEGDPIWCVNYLEICLSEIGPNLSAEDRKKIKSFSEEKEKAFVERKLIENYRLYLKTHSASVLAAYKASPTEKVRNKYHWLIQYHNDTVKKMTPALKDCLIRIPSIRKKTKG